MPDLPKETIERITSDLSHVSKSIENILSGKDVNCLVMDTDYIDPTIIAGSVPFDAHMGEFQYYSRIRTALELALTTGCIPKGMCPSRAPDYINKLVSP